MTRPMTYADRCQLREIGFVRQGDGGAERRAKLERARQAVLTCKAVIDEIHRSVNLVDAVQGLETALADIQFEEERDE